jgi:formamidopyrimidine-DNA glycosylase
MPELPEVETVVRQNRRRLTGRRIVAFESLWPRQASPSVAAVRNGIVGRTIVEVSRRAKWIVAKLDDDAVFLVHLRMSGRFEWAGDTNGDHRPQHVRATWDFDNGSRLLFSDARKFGRIVFTADLESATGDLGLEPLDRRFTVAALANVLGRRSRRLKPLLLDQTVIAGLGNIYTDEALFRAGLHPLTQSDRLRDEQVARLHEAIRHVLRTAIRNKGTMFDWVYPEGRMQDSLMVYGRGGEPCRRCGAPIRVLRVGQRGTHVCTRCQPLRQRRFIAPARTRPARSA